MGGGGGAVGGGEDFNPGNSRLNEQYLLTKKNHKLQGLKSTSGGYR